MRGATLLLAAALVVPLGAATPLDAGDPLRAEQYALDAIHAPDAWATATGDGVRVAVVDSGVDHGHHDLATAIDHAGASSVAQPVGAYSNLPAGPWNTTQDTDGHGTQVAGLLAAERGNGLGIAGASAATVIPVKVAEVGAPADTDRLAAAVEAALDADADLVQVSFVSHGTGEDLVEALERAERAGVPVVAAAGNLGEGEPGWPAQAPTVVAVGAVEPDLSPWPASNEGVDMVAPGVDVLTTTVPNAFEETSGTSFATPLVSATAALMLDACPSLDPVQLRSTLNTTAEDLSTPGPDAATGWGLVHADRATTAAADTCS